MKIHRFSNLSKISSNYNLEMEIKIKKEGK